MVACNFIVLLISLCFLQSLCIDERPTDTLETKKTNSDNEINDTGQPAAISKEGNEVISPGPGLGEETHGKTSVLTASFKVSIEEKSVEIEQQDLGKTKELNEGPDKEDGKKVENEKVNGQDEKKVEEEEGQEEKGIDLKVLNDHDFEHLTQAATGATTGDWLVLL
jgi:hypothetical protein